MGQAAKGNRVDVVIVDPLSVIRVGLNLILSGQDDMRVVAEAATADDGFEAITRLRRRSGAVILVGLELAGEHDAFWLIQAVREGFPSHRVLVSGADTDGIAISRAFFTGADGFVHKNSEPDRLLDAIRRTAEGGIVIEGLPRGALGEIAEGMEVRRTTTLTTREREVLSAAAEGLTARQIGRRLGVRERTVTTHLGHIYRKLGATSRVAAVVAAGRSGLLRLGVQTTLPLADAGQTALDLSPRVMETAS